MIVAPMEIECNCNSSLFTARITIYSFHPPAQSPWKQKAVKRQECHRQNRTPVCGVCLCACAAYRPLQQPWVLQVRGPPAKIVNKR